MIKIIICGINGQMGQVLAETVRRHENMQLAAGVDIFPDARENGVPVYKNIADCKEEANVIIDLSRPAALDANLHFAICRKIPIIIATTGYAKEDKRKIKEASLHIPVFFSANMSLGVNMQFEIVKQIADFYGNAVDIEIIERHHNLKVDAPSGTALALADIINASYDGRLMYQYGRGPSDGKRTKNEIGIHAVRGGTFVGEHDVLFITDSEVLTVSHTAQTKQVFADGALRAVEFIIEKSPGLYNMKNIVYQTRTVTSFHKWDGEAVIRVANLPNTAEATADVLALVADQGIYVDIITQSVAQDNRAVLSFSLAKRDLQGALRALDALVGAEVTYIDGLSKITVEGLGMEVAYGVAAKLFRAVAQANVDIVVVTTDETKVTFCVKEEQADAAISAIAAHFQR